MLVGLKLLFTIYFVKKKIHTENHNLKSSFKCSYFEHFIMISFLFRHIRYVHFKRYHVIHKFES